MQFVKQYLLKHYICLATTYADNAALPAFARSAAAFDRYLLPAGPTAANLQQPLVAAERTDRQTDRLVDGWTDRRTPDSSVLCGQCK